MKQKPCCIAKYGTFSVLIEVKTERPSKLAMVQSRGHNGVPPKLVVLGKACAQAD
jgi:hypothetical protein